jgi:hypothetical protein
MSSEFDFDALSEVRLHSSLSSLPDVILVTPFNHNVHHRQLLAEAAYGSLKPLPTSDSEGPTFIFRTAGRFLVFLTQPAYRTGQAELPHPALSNSAAKLFPDSTSPSRRCSFRMYR